MVIILAFLQFWIVVVLATIRSDTISYRFRISLSRERCHKKKVKNHVDDIYLSYTSLSRSHARTNNLYRDGRSMNCTSSASQLKAGCAARWTTFQRGIVTQAICMKYGQRSRMNKLTNFDGYRLTTKIIAFE